MISQVKSGMICLQVITSANARRFEMGRNKRKVDYRQLYKDYYNIEFGSDMVVHHIDLDRTNNDIGNLLLLPNWLHAKYHVTLQMLTGLHGEIDLNKELRLTTPMVTAHYSQWLRKMADVLDEVAPWIRMKFDYEIWPSEVFVQAYRTKLPITEDSVR